MTNEKNLKKIGAIFALMAIPAAGLAGCAPDSGTTNTTIVTPPVQTTTNNPPAPQAMTTQVVDQMTQQNSQATTTPTATPTSTTSAYKDGTYTATGNYISPGGAEHIDVSLTLKGGVVTASTVTKGAERPISVNMQTMFVNNYKEQVEGKNIDEINLTKVSGSSLTPKGFDDALAKIKAEAKA